MASKSSRTQNKGEATLPEYSESPYGVSIKSNTVTIDVRHGGSKQVREDMKEEANPGAQDQGKAGDNAIEEKQEDTAGLASDQAAQNVDKQPKKTAGESITQLLSPEIAALVADGEESSHSIVEQRNKQTVIKAPTVETDPGSPNAQILHYENARENRSSPKFKEAASDDVVAEVNQKDDTSLYSDLDQSRRREQLMNDHIQRQSASAAELAELDMAYNKDEETSEAE